MTTFDETPNEIGVYTVAQVNALTDMVQGSQAWVTDLTTPTWHGTLTGGGAVFGKVYYNGTAWVCG